MKRTLFLSTCLMFAGALLPAPCAYAAAPMPAHLAPWLGQATPTGAAEDSRPVHLSLFLG